MVKTLALHYKDRIGLVAETSHLFDKGHDSCDLCDPDVRCKPVDGEILEHGLWSCGLPTLCV